MKKTKSRKQLCSAAIMVFLLVALDQLTKYLAVLKLKIKVLHLVWICFQLFRGYFISHTGITIQWHFCVPK